jgi:8-hydroxy-5-deazaflavin:NADPH oxidoreductase
MNISIIGEGNVGSALAKGFEKAGHSASVAGNDPARVKELAASGDIIVLAVPFGALNEVVANIGNAADGKTVVDVTNALSPDFKLAVGHTTSGAEELQKKLPNAKVVKAFNTVFANAMATGENTGTPLTVFVAADDADAKSTIIELGKSIGFDAVDAGPLANARLLEPMAFLNIQLGFVLGQGMNIGLKLVR